MAKPQRAAHTEAGPWPEGFDGFYRTHYAGMVRLASLITMRQAVGEEIVQDAFVAVAVRWDDVRRPEPYLRSAVINYSRTAASRSLRERLVDTVPETFTNGDINVPADMKQVWYALHRLTPRRRTAVVLRFYEDLDDREIADLMACRPSTVRSLVHRATRQLRKELA